MRYFLLFILLSLNSYAGNDEPHPIIDSDYVSKYLYNTKDLSTSNLIEIKETLLSFKDTFKEIIDDNRPLVKNLRDYKAYDFRLGSAYLAMMTAFHSREDTKKFYFQLVKDKKNKNTSIGKYNFDLVSEQEKIIKVKLNIEKQIEANDLIAKLQEVENEISSRN